MAINIGFEFTTLGRKGFYAVNEDVMRLAFDVHKDESTHSFQWRASLALKRGSFTTFGDTKESFV